MIACLRLLTRFLVSLLKSRRRLEAENVILRHQLNVLRRAAPPKLRLTSTDWLIFAWWRRGGFRLYWRWKSRSPGGRPKISQETRQLIREISLVNPLWDAPRIHGELLRLGIEVWQTAVAKCAAYGRRVERLAARVAPLGLGADLIVGFPGESDADHRSTVRLVEELPFTYLHVFPYSSRRGTAAPRLGVPPAAAAVRERGAELRGLGERKARAHLAARAGASADLVLEGRRGGWREAVTEDYLTAVVPADAPWVLGRSRVAARLVPRGSALQGERA